MPASTSNRGYPVPLASDPPAGATQMTDLGTAIDADVESLDQDIQTKSPSNHQHTSQTTIPAASWGLLQDIQLNPSTGNNESTGTFSPWTNVNVSMAANRRYLIMAQAIVRDESTTNTNGTGADIQLGVSSSSIAETSVWITSNAIANQQGITLFSMYTSSSAATRAVGLRIDRTSNDGRPTYLNAEIVVIDCGPA